jgi:hypothetical protein
VRVWPQSEWSILARSRVTIPAHDRATPRMQPSCAVSHPVECTPCFGWRNTAKGSSQFGISVYACAAPQLRRLQPGAPHSSFGMYLEMTQRASTQASVLDIFDVSAGRLGTARIPSSITLEALVPFRDSSGSHCPRCMGLMTLLASHSGWDGGITRRILPNSRLTPVSARAPSSRPAALCRVPPSGHTP